MRKVGQLGPEVTPIGHGCMGETWQYGDTGGDDPVDVIRRAADVPGCHLDTADMYGPFTSELRVGRAIAGRRDEIFLATKGGCVVDDRATRRLHFDGRPEHLRAACDASLARLGVDHVDLYYLHRVDPAAPLEESWEALSELVAAGKARQIGLSMVDVDQLERAHRIHPVAAVQSELSLWTRDPLDDVIPWCRDHGTTFVAFAPLGRGFLAGELEHYDQLPERDMRRSLPRYQPGAIEANRVIADGIKVVADRHGAHPAQIALAWVLARGPHVIAIPGTTKLAHLESNIAAGRLPLSAEDLAELDRLPEPVGGRH